MIVGAAVLPAAPLLVPGVSATLPAGVAKVMDAVDAVVESLPVGDLTVLVGTGEGGLHATGRATLEGVGRPDIVLDVDVDGGAVSRIAAATQYPMYQGSTLPLDLGVLALHVGDSRAVVPLSVPATAAFDVLVGLGSSIARVLGDADVRAVLVVAGDLSAGLTEQSPLYVVDGADVWDELAVAAVDSGRLDTLERLGPEEAQRVGARAWAPLAVLHGATASAKLGMVVRHYSAPRGVGYLVASGA